MRVELARGLWRPMTEADLAAVSAVAERVHIAYPEDYAILPERLALYPAGCAVMEWEGNLAGYALTHPWRYADPPALNVMLGEIPRDPNTYYIHDLAMLPETRGSGAGSAIVEAVIAHAAATGAPNVSLVAVNDSVPFWSRLGFEVVAQPALVAKLLTYDDKARFMVLSLSPSPSMGRGSGPALGEGRG